MDFGFENDGGFGVESGAKHKKKKKKDKDNYGDGGFGGGLDLFDKPSDGGGAFGGGVGNFPPDAPRQDDRRTNFDDDTHRGSGLGGSPGGYADAHHSNGSGGYGDRDRRDRDRDAHGRDRYGGHQTGHHDQDRFGAEPPRDRFEDSAFSSGREAYRDRSPHRLPDELDRAGTDRRREVLSDLRHHSARGYDLNRGTGASPPEKFSFSLADLPDGMRRSPHYVGQSPPRGLPPHAHSKWNPLEGIQRHWSGGQDEVKPLPTHFPSEPSAASTAPRLAAPGGLASPPSLLRPGSLEEELSRSEGRAQALRMKIRGLESDVLGGQAVFPGGDGFTKIVVPHLPPNGRLGLTMKDTIVTAFTDPLCQQFGWVIGDRVMAVNGVPIHSAPELGAQLQRGIAENNVTGRPFVFDVWRAQPAVSPHGSRHGSPFGSYAAPPVAMAPLMPHAFGSPPMCQGGAPHIVPPPLHPGGLVPHPPVHPEVMALQHQVAALAHENAMLRDHQEHEDFAHNDHHDLPVHLHPPRLGPPPMTQPPMPCTPPMPMAPSMPQTMPPNGQLMQPSPSRSIYAVDPVHSRPCPPASAFPPQLSPSACAPTAGGQFPPGQFPGGAIGPQFSRDSQADTRLSQDLPSPYQDPYSGQLRTPRSQRMDAMDYVNSTIPLQPAAAAQSRPQAPQLSFGTSTVSVPQSAPPPLLQPQRLPQDAVQPPVSCTFPMAMQQTTMSAPSRCMTNPVVPDYRPELSRRPPSPPSQSRGSAFETAPALPPQRSASPGPASAPFASMPVATRSASPLRVASVPAAQFVAPKQPWNSMPAVVVTQPPAMQSQPMPMQTYSYSLPPPRTVALR